MIAGRKVVTFRSASSPSARFVGLEAPGLHELGEAGARRGIVLDDEHPLGCGRLRLRNF